MVKSKKFIIVYVAIVLAPIQTPPSLTSWFGEAGNILLGGHSVALDGSQDALYNLDKVQVGNLITINDNGNHYMYQITESRVHVLFANRIG